MIMTFSEYLVEYKEDRLWSGKLDNIIRFVEYLISIGVLTDKEKSEYERIKDEYDFDMSVENEKKYESVLKKLIKKYGKLRDRLAVKYNDVYRNSAFFVEKMSGNKRVNYISLVNNFKKEVVDSGVIELFENGDKIVKIIKKLDKIYDDLDKKLKKFSKEYSLYDISRSQRDFIASFYRDKRKGDFYFDDVDRLIDGLSVYLDDYDIRNKFDREVYSLYEKYIAVATKELTPEVKKIVEYIKKYINDVVTKKATQMKRGGNRVVKSLDI